MFRLRQHHWLLAAIRYVATQEEGSCRRTCVQPSRSGAGQDASNDVPRVSISARSSALDSPVQLCAMLPAALWRPSHRAGAHLCGHVPAQRKRRGPSRRVHAGRQRDAGALRPQHGQVRPVKLFLAEISLRSPRNLFIYII